jgi:hypothetical protein
VEIVDRRGSHRVTVAAGQVGLHLR